MTHRLAATVAFALLAASALAQTDSGYKVSKKVRVGGGGAGTI
jgi:hypothetical protein